MLERTVVIIGLVIYDRKSLVAVVKVETYVLHHAPEAVTVVVLWQSFYQYKTKTKNDNLLNRRLFFN